MKGGLLAGDPEAPPVPIDQDLVLLTALAKGDVFTGEDLRCVGVKVDGFWLVADLAASGVLPDADGVQRLIATRHQVSTVFKDGLEEANTG